MCRRYRSDGLVFLVPILASAARMADPLSIAASVLTIAELAARSYECLYKYTKGFLEADDELKDHLAAVKNLSSIFFSIGALKKNNPDLDCHLTADFDDRLKTCLAELRAIESSVLLYNAQFERSRARRALAKARWSSVDNRQKLKRKLDRIELHRKLFSMDLMLLNV